MREREIERERAREREEGENKIEKRMRYLIYIHYVDRDY